MKWACRCGQFEAEVDVIATRDSRLVCYCASCRAFAEQTGASDSLDAAGGVDLVQTAIERVRFTKGTERLAWTKLSPKGPLRWFAECCGAPVANTLATRTIPFATIMSSGFKDQDSLPPVAARVNRKGATAHIEGDMGNAGRVTRAFFLRAARSYLNGGWRRNPFFDARGRPIADGPIMPGDRKPS